MKASRVLLACCYQQFRTIYILYPNDVTKTKLWLLGKYEIIYMPPWDYYSKDILLFCSSELDTFKDSTSHHNFLFVSFSDLYFPEISLLGTWLINKCDCLLKPTLLSYVN